MNLENVEVLKEVDKNQTITVKQDDNEKNVTDDNDVTDDGSKDHIDSVDLNENKDQVIGKEIGTINEEEEDLEEEDDLNINGKDYVGERVCIWIICF